MMMCLRCLRWLRRGCPGKPEGAGEDAGHEEAGEAGDVPGHVEH